MLDGNALVVRLHGRKHPIPNVGVRPSWPDSKQIETDFNSLRDSRVPITLEHDDCTQVVPGPRFEEEL